jgi:molybdenum cofactor biosynthesis enzyme MoaA
MTHDRINKLFETDYVVPKSWQQGVPYDQNPYPSILVDITARCNMLCNFCYYTDRTVPDMSPVQFEKFCRSLPEPVLIKLAGGEPTLHPKLPEFIRISSAYSHRIYICSNGMRYNDPAFMETLRPLQKNHIPFGLGLSMDGGTKHAEAYRLITGKDCLKDKLDAFKALIAYGHNRVSLTAIIIRGFNEDVIPQLIELAKQHPRTVGYLHFRNAGRFGAFVETEPYSIEELKEITARYFTPKEFAPACIGEVHCPPETGRTCCFRFRPTRRLQISLIEFASERSAQCPKRGRVILGDERVYPLFHSIRNEM